MEQVLELAGFAAAHAVWCVSDGESLVPMVMFQCAASGPEVLRFQADRLEECVEQGKRWLSDNPEKAVAAVLVYDGFISLATGKTDALILEVRFFREHEGLVIVVPYRHARMQGGFAVHRPQFQCSKEQAMLELAQPFFEGIARHEKGAAVWERHVDEST